jgi:hypothetical protein
VNRNKTTITKISATIILDRDFSLRENLWHFKPVSCGRWRDKPLSKFFHASLDAL